MAIAPQHLTPEVALEGVPASDAACTACDASNVPLVQIRAYADPVDYSLCVFCLGDAIADATGWKVGVAFRQWDMSRQMGAQYRALKVQERARERDRR